MSEVRDARGIFVEVSDKLNYVTENVEKLKKMTEFHEMQVRDARGIFVEVGDKLNYVTENLEKLKNKITEFHEMQKLTLMGLNYLVEFAEGKSTKNLAQSQFAVGVASILDSSTAEPINFIKSCKIKKAGGSK